MSSEEVTVSREAAWRALGSKAWHTGMTTIARFTLTLQALGHCSLVGAVCCPFPTPWLWPLCLGYLRPPLPLLPSKPPWAHVFKCRLSGMTVTTQESRCCPLGFFSLKDSLKPNSRGSCTQRRLVGVTHHHPWPPWSGESGHNHPYHAVGISGGPPFSAGAPRAPEDPLLDAPSPAGTQKGKNSGSQCTRRAGKVRQESKWWPGDSLEDCPGEAGVDRTVCSLFTLASFT